jgi:hypothetical protein
MPRDSSLPPAAPGRGATRNDRPVRFGLASRESDGDWLDSREEIDGAAPIVRTTVTVERPRTIITRNASPDVPFDRSINAYRGCEHGCIYCFARPTHAFHDLSPGLDFETRLFAKPDAAKLLRAELAARSYVPKPIALGTNTDPYQPIEGTWRITREVIEILHETRHPFTITTKSDRVVRDLDLIAPMAAKGLVAVVLSIWSRARRALPSVSPPCARSPTRGSSAMSPSRRSSRRSPIMSWSISWRPLPRLARAAPSSCPSGFRTKSRPYFEPGWMSTIPIARPR